MKDYNSNINIRISEIKAGLRSTLRQQKKQSRLTFQDHTEPELRPSGTFRSAIIYDLGVTAMILRQSETALEKYNSRKSTI